MTPPRPLDNIRVLDLTRVLAGPFCTAYLADLGAEVIKLEPPQGDDYRHIGPFRDGESALFLLNNRGKKSLAVDLKTPEGLALARDIAAKCDVVVENFRPGVAGKIGLGADDLCARDPGLIYCSISGFGQSGPLRDLPAYDLVVQAMSGLMAATGEEGGEPLKTGESIGDIAAGLHAASAIMAALVQKARTGTGSRLDVAMYDVLFSMLTTSHAVHFYGGTLPRRVGNRHPLSTPFGCFHTSDGQVVIAVLNPTQFDRFASLIGRDGLAEDPRFASDSARTKNESALRSMIENWSRDLSTEAAISALSGAGIACAPIWDIARAADNDHAKARGLVQALAHPVLGPAPMVPQPVLYDGQKPAATSPAPGLGADAVAVLGAFCGIGADRLDELVTKGVITRKGRS